ncbi:hypothetical protein A3H16_00260 [Candidatus Kaiserbacteria bacterium RIFCSPLOWO2_12_FULL_53_8]|uniref:Uncharacterized protein n=2 Tax=Candidatus Kaiseribacteriota TaxID=1752734 RepID=A0A1F6CUA6_9BACT|nr:MAG: hypothetical protein A2851_03985 [Candidatus Kaiserbacteria bacterium RIFCSPHIGHO2_01_FULL_53_29]OGG91850.1 MAG: hypothetical protein A3H16_00260 [Candidatus Kaiserbacteria bacterium RIFCSPLOWO2_12_FULL_53_8]
MIESFQNSRDSEEPLNYGQMKEETFGADRVINADEVERRGRDITDRVVGQALKRGHFSELLIGEKHIVALVRHNDIVQASDITGDQEREEFYADMNSDEKDGVLTDSSNYRVFLLSDEDYAACSSLQQ